MSFDSFVSGIFSKLGFVLNRDALKNCFSRFHLRHTLTHSVTLMFIWFVLLPKGFERVWCMAHRRGANDIAIGYDEGVIVVRVSFRLHSIFRIRSTLSFSMCLLTQHLEVDSLVDLVLRHALSLSSAATSRPCPWTRAARSSGRATPRSSRPSPQKSVSGHSFYV